MKEAKEERDGPSEKPKDLKEPATARGDLTTQGPQRALLHSNSTKDTDNLSKQLRLSSGVKRSFLTPICTSSIRCHVPDICLTARMYPSRLGVRLAMACNGLHLTPAKEVTAKEIAGSEVAAKEVTAAMGA